MIKVSLKNVLRFCFITFDINILTSNALFLRITIKNDSNDKYFDYISKMLYFDQFQGFRNWSNVRGAIK